MALIPAGFTTEEWVNQMQANLKYARELLAGCLVLPENALMISPIDGRIMGNKKTAIETAQRLKKQTEAIWQELVDTGIVE